MCSRKLHQVSVALLLLTSQPAGARVTGSEIKCNVCFSEGGHCLYQLRQLFFKNITRFYQVCSKRSLLCRPRYHFAHFCPWSHFFSFLLPIPKLYHTVDTSGLSSSVVIVAKRRKITDILERNVVGVIATAFQSLQSHMFKGTQHPSQLNYVCTQH